MAAATGRPAARKAPEAVRAGGDPGPQIVGQLHDQIPAAEEHEPRAPRGIRPVEAHVEPEARAVERGGPLGIGRADHHVVEAGDPARAGGRRGGRGASRWIRKTRTPWVAAVAARVRRQRRRAPVARSTLSAAATGSGSRPSRVSRRWARSMSSTAKARLASPSPCASRTARRRSALGAVARRRDQLRRDVGELEDRGLGPAAGRFRAPGRGRPSRRW